MTVPAASGWLAVAASRDLARRPLRIVHAGRPFVLFREAGEPKALVDRCPHRGARLSAGRVRADGLECPYHGWRFGGDGRCRAIPGNLGPLPSFNVPTLSACEADGLVFLRVAPGEAPPYCSVLHGEGVVSRRVRSLVRSSLLDVAENILDATHTHFTHKGILRGLSTRRNRVEVSVTAGEGWVEARYEGEPRQEGLVSRLLEGERSISVGRFLAPGICELEFWGRGKINLATTFHLRAEAQGVVAGIGLMRGPFQNGLGLLKAALFMPLFKTALWQDRVILNAVTANAAYFPAAKPAIGPLDVMRANIAAILAGERPPAADAPVRLMMEL